jgi:hypothetical protein
MTVLIVKPSRLAEKKQNIFFGFLNGRHFGLIHAGSTHHHSKTGQIRPVKNSLDRFVTNKIFVMTLFFIKTV